MFGTPMSLLRMTMNRAFGLAKTFFHSLISLRLVKTKIVFEDLLKLTLFPEHGYKWWCRRRKWRWNRIASVRTVGGRCRGGCRRRRRRGSVRFLGLTVCNVRAMSYGCDDRFYNSRVG